MLIPVVAVSCHGNCFNHRFQPLKAEVLRLQDRGKPSSGKQKPSNAAAEPAAVIPATSPQHVYGSALEAAAAAASTMVREKAKSLASLGQRTGVGGRQSLGQLWF